MSSESLFVICPLCGDGNQLRGESRCAECGFVWSRLIEPYYLTVGALDRARRKLEIALKRYDIGPKTSKYMQVAIDILAAALDEATAVLGGQDAKE